MSRGRPGTGGVLLGVTSTASADRLMAEGAVLVDLDAVRSIDRAEGGGGDDQRPAPVLQPGRPRWVLLCGGDEEDRRRYVATLPDGCPALRVVDD